MLNVVQSWALSQAVVEKEVFDARRKGKAELLRAMGGASSSPIDAAAAGSAPKAPPVSSFPGIVYDASGKPRPAPMAYDSTHSDVPPADLDDEDVPDDDNPFPNLYPPLG